MAEAADYRRLAIVACAPVGICEDLRKVRAGCPRSGRPVMDAHVAVKRGFDPVADAVGLMTAIRGLLDGVAPFSVRTREAIVSAQADFSNVLMPLEACPPLRRLHERFLTTLAPLVGTNPGEAAFDPHLSIVEHIPHAGVEQTLRAVDGWRVNYAWVVRDLDLVGLTSTGVWRSLGHFSFGHP